MEARAPVGRPETSAGAERGKRRKRRVVVNLSACKYDVLRWAAKKRAWRVCEEEDATGWYLWWTDTSVAPARVMALQEFQRINHFPGMHAIYRKANLAAHMSAMQRVFPADYRFFPRTWRLPGEYSEFKQQFTGRGGQSKRTFIVKPDASCQGKGIFLTTSLRGLNPTEPQVAQQYVTRPLLIDGFKFDLRIYVLVTCCAPLRMFMYGDGLTRLATMAYQAPTRRNMRQVCMHLTNYAINKDASGFVANEDASEDGVGSKRSLRWFLGWLAAQGHDAEAVWWDIADVAIKTLTSAQPELAHTYRSCFATRREDDGFSCFELLGFDIMLDRRLRPWLLEVNHSPSFSLSSPLDRSIKQRLIMDTLALANVSAQDERRFRLRRAAAAKQRLAGVSVKDSGASMAKDVERIAARRRLGERRHAGQYRCIYPPPPEAPFAEADFEPLRKAAALMFDRSGGIGAARSISSDADRAALAALAQGKAPTGSSARAPPAVWCSSSGT